MKIDTPHGPALVHLETTEHGRAALLLGHGAGGGVSAPDLVSATRAAHHADVHVALVEQPYRVANRRSPRRPGNWTRRGSRSQRSWPAACSTGCR